MNSAASSRLAVLERPWFWFLAMGLMCGLPLFGMMSQDFPDVPPGMDGPAMELTLADEYGRQVSLANLVGYLVIVTELPLANQTETDRVFDGIRALRKRLRGMGMGVVFMVLCHGGEVSDLSAVLTAKTARKPVNLFLMDEGHEEMDLLRQRAGSNSARFFLLDRHSRVRGAYGDSEDDIDALVYLTGLLGNWPGADLEPGSVPVSEAARDS